MPNGSRHSDHTEVVPAARGCAVLISAAACGMALLMVLVVACVLLFVAPAVERSIENREAAAPGITDFVLGIPWWATLLIGLLLAGFAVVKELAISHALANFIINVLLLGLMLGFCIIVVVGLIAPYLS